MCRRVIRNAAVIHRPLALAGASRMGANGSDKDLEDYFAISRHKLEIIDDFDKLAGEEIFQIMIGCREKDYPAILKDVKGARDHRLVGPGGGYYLSNRKQRIWNRKGSGLLRT